MIRLPRARGLTLLETTLALTLLASLASVSVSWSMGFARLAGQTASIVNQRRALNELQRSVQDDLANRDDTITERKPERITARTHQLQIHTRLAGLGASTVVYRFEPRTGELTRQAGGLTEPILGGINDARFEYGEDVLRVKIRFDSDTARFLLDSDGRVIWGDK